MNKFINFLICQFPSSDSDWCFDELFKIKKSKVRGFIGKLLKRKEIEEESEVCPECKKPLIVREGMKGKFWGCTGYAENGCSYTRDFKGKEPE